MESGSESRQSSPLLSDLFHSNLHLPQTPEHVGITVRGKELDNGFPAIPLLFLPSAYSALPTILPHLTVSLLPSVTHLSPSK